MNKILRPAAFLLIFALLLILEITLIPDEFAESYQRVWVRQYDYFRSLQGNKILFIGPSSLSQGFDLDLFEQLSSRQGAILGNHFGHGYPFLLNMSKENLSSGDIVVIEYVSTTLDSCAPELILTGIGKRYDMYRFLPREIWGKLWTAYPNYLQKNLSYWREGGYLPNPLHSMAAYDARGNMTYVREGTINPNPYNGAMIDYYTADAEFDEDYIAFFNDYIDWCRKRGVKVFFTVQPQFDESVAYTQDDADAFDNKAQSLLNAPFVSRHNDYVFSREYSYDTVHLNTKGARLRTEMLYEELKPYL